MGVRYLEKIESFGRHLKKLREERSLSQQALADMADISKKTVTRIENGKNAPTLDMLFALSNALEIPFMKLMDFDGGD